MEIREQDASRVARVDFGGTVREVRLDYVPELEVGDYAVVHLGFALQRLDEKSALETLALFAELGDLDAETT